jgi:hypothetical protein
VVGLGQVGELEEEGEDARKLVGGVAGEGLDAVERVLQMLPDQGGLGIAGVRIVEGSVVSRGTGIGFAAADGGAAQVFDGLVEVLARLLAQDFAQQHTERAHGAAQRRFLQLAGGRLKFCQSLRPVGWGPKRGHRLLCTGGGGKPDTEDYAGSDAGTGN